jgi:hypothetical protein
VSSDSCGRMSRAIKLLPDEASWELRALTSSRARLLQSTTSKAQITSGLSLGLDEKRGSRQSS